ncbi:serine/threonine-protein kinase [Streptomyces sp. NPDC004778]
MREDFAADPGFGLRFADEVASARRIHGLFTAQVIDSGVDDPVPWLATAYVPGSSLEQAVRHHGPLPPRTVLLLMAGIAETLRAIHGAGVVHRDLKPANVLLAEDGPRVIDFGIARAAGAVHLTGTGVRIGTAAYMAPEQAMGLPVTPTVDVFALGALAAYVAGGAPPFGPGPVSATLYRVAHEPPDLSRVAPELHDLLWGCLAKQPELRPAPNDVIAAVHAHPCVAPAVEFTHGWLPPGLYGEIGRGEGHGPPTPVHVAPTRARPTPTRVRFAPDAEAAHDPDLPAATGGTSPAPGAGARHAPGFGADPDARRRRTRRWGRGALVGAACLLLLAAAVAVPHLRDGPDRADASSSPAPRRTGPQTPYRIRRPPPPPTRRHRRPPGTSRPTRTPN